MDYRFQVGDIVRVTGIKLSKSSETFLNRVGTVMYINDTFEGDKFARQAYAVAFDNLPSYAGHPCELRINEEVVFALDGIRGNWFKEDDLEIVCSADVITIDLDIL